MKVGKEVKSNVNSERIPAKTLFYIVVLILVSLFLGSLPAISLGQNLSFPVFSSPIDDAKDATNSADASAGAAFSPVLFDTSETGKANPSDFPVPPAPKPAKAELPVGSPKPALIEVPVKPSPPVSENLGNSPADSPARRGPMIAGRAPMSKTQPHPQPLAARASVAEKTGQVVSGEPSPEQLLRQPELLKSVAQPDHPFTPYFGLPTDPQSQIRGKSYHVAQLLDKVGHPAQRSQLLDNYWELAGLLAEYNMYYDAENRVGALYKDAERSNDIQKKSFLQGSYYLLQPQRQAAELSFVKKQHELVERIKSIKNVSFTEENLPIPCDLPVFKQYETYADSLARTQRSQSIAKLIPIQHKLVEARIVGYGASDRLLQDAMRNPANASNLVESLKQRSRTYSELIGAVVDYNKMIAGYTSETVGPGVSSYRLVGALIKLPKHAPETAPENRRTTDIAAPPGNNFSAAPIPGIMESNDFSQPEPALLSDVHPVGASIHSPYASNRRNGTEPGHPKTFAPQRLPQPSPQPGTRSTGTDDVFGAVGFAGAQPLGTSSVGPISEVPPAANPLRSPGSNIPTEHSPIQPVSLIGEKMGERQPLPEETPPQPPVSKESGSL